MKLEFLLKLECCNHLVKYKIENNLHYKIFSFSYKNYLCNYTKIMNNYILYIYYI